MGAVLDVGIRGNGRGAAAVMAREHTDPQAAVWRDVVDAVAAASNTLLVLHVRPDGDSVGCCIAMARCLRSLGRRATIVCPDPIPANLAFLDPDGECAPPDMVSGPFDLALFLDCADLDRLGAARPLADAAARRVNVDHHGSNARYGDVNYVEPGAAACGEIVYRLMADLGVRPDAAAATALYAALATDTGSFRFENTTDRTFAIAADLVQRGADAALVGREVWGSRSLASLRVLARALRTLGIDAGGRLAWMSLTHAAMAAAGASPEDCEGLVDYPRSLRGVEVAAMFVVDEPGSVRVSLRSRRTVDVAALAAQFGGGGHARAAGCTVSGSLAPARRAVLDAARRALAGAGAAWN